jgi:hypothetical protein
VENENCWNTGGLWKHVGIIPVLLRTGKMKIVGILVVYGNMLEY